MPPPNRNEGGRDHACRWHSSALRDLIKKLVDFDRLRAESPIDLFISATRIRDGKARIFTREDISVDALLASACLPHVHHSVEIDGEVYWDGGFSANSPLQELIWGTRSRHLLLVELVSPFASGLPNLTPDIDKRILELVFIGHYHRELESLEGMIRSCRKATGRLSDRGQRLREIEIQRIAGSDRIHADDAGR